jgi:hypothetical protein
MNHPVLFPIEKDSYKEWLEDRVNTIIVFNRNGNDSKVRSLLYELERELKKKGKLKIGVRK